MDRKVAIQGQAMGSIPALIENAQGKCVLRDVFGWTLEMKCRVCVGEGDVTCGEQ